MSTVVRVVSGSAASWAKIAMTILSQLVIVPIYISYWDIKTYGLNLAIMSLASVITTLDFGHQTFIGYEFLKKDHKTRNELSEILCSGLLIGIILSIVQVVIILVIITSGILPDIIEKSEKFSKQATNDAGKVLIIQGLIWIFSTSIPGLLSRALAPFGHYSRMSWWYFLFVSITTITPAIAVIFGANLLEASITTLYATIIYCIPLYIDIFKLLKRERIIFIKPSGRIGWRNFKYSLIISGKGLIESVRQQGIRLVLIPLLGTSGLAAFSTIRTGANTALQGLNTVTGPLMPELMRFLRQRDQARSETAFNTIWIIVIGILCPAVVIMQVVIVQLFSIWTRGKIPFDPILFASLSLSVLVFAAAQPAISIVTGNNLLKPQLILSVLSAIVVLLGCYILVPSMGIKGAGISLLIAEVVSSIGYKVYSKNWLEENELKWPRQAANVVQESLVISSITIFLIVYFPMYKLNILAIYIIFLIWNIHKYWNSLPTIAVTQAKRLFNTMFRINKVPSIK